MTIKDTTFQDITPDALYDADVAATTLDEVAESVNTIKETATGFDHTATAGTGHDHTDNGGPRIPRVPTVCVGTIVAPWVCGYDPNNPYSTDYHKIPITPKNGDHNTAAGADYDWYEYSTSSFTGYDTFGIFSDVKGIVNGEEPIHWATTNPITRRFLLMPMTYPDTTPGAIYTVYNKKDSPSSLSSATGAAFLYTMGTNAAGNQDRTFRYAVDAKASQVVCKFFAIATFEKYREEAGYAELRDNPSTASDDWMFKFRIYNETDADYGEYTYIYASQFREKWAQNFPEQKIAPVELTYDIPSTFSGISDKLWSIQFICNTSYPEIDAYFPDWTDGDNMDQCGLQNMMVWFQSPQLDSDDKPQSPQPLVYMSNRY